MSITIGQISYLPDNELRSKRLEEARFQLDYLNKLLPNTPIHRVCQNYEFNEVDTKGNYIYTMFAQGIGPAKARNIILESFYRSDYDWLLLVDDDTVWYEYYKYEEFIRDVSNNEKKFEGVDAISAVEPEYHAYKKSNYQDRANLTHYKFIPRDLGSGSATTLIRNIKKFYNKEIYYPDIDPVSGNGLEDVEFHMAWLKEGFTWYTMQTWIRKSLCFNKSTIWDENSEERVAKLKTCLRNLCERHKEDGLYMTDRNTVSWKEFNNRYNRSFKTKYIQRNEPIEYTEKEMPKEKPSMTQLLF